MVAPQIYFKKKKSKHCFAGSISTALHANGKNENNWGISRVLFTEVVRKKEVFGVSVGGVSAPNFVKSPVLRSLRGRGVVLVVLM